MEFFCLFVLFSIFCRKMCFLFFAGTDIGMTQLASPVGGYLHWCVSFGSQEGVSSRGGLPGWGKAAWFPVLLYLM